MSTTYFSFSKTLDEDEITMNLATGVDREVEKKENAYEGFRNLEYLSGTTVQTTDDEVAELLVEIVSVEVFDKTKEEAINLVADVVDHAKEEAINLVTDVMDQANEAVRDKPKPHQTSEWRIIRFAMYLVRYLCIRASKN